VGTGLEASAKSAEANLGGRETILIVEDEANVRQVAVRMLESLGYKVHQAEDGAAALALLRNLGEIDLLFTDLIMPNGVSGQELARQAREQRPGLNILYASGYSETFITRHGNFEPTAPLIGKPYRKRQLATAVRAIFDGKSPSTSPAT